MQGEADGQRARKKDSEREEREREKSLEKNRERREWAGVDHACGSAYAWAFMKRRRED